MVPACGPEGRKGTVTGWVWAGCQQVPHPLQTHREGAQGLLGLRPQSSAPAGVDLGSPELLGTRRL